MRQLVFGVLGPLEASVDGTPVSLGRPQQRAVLAILLLLPNRPVSTDRLIELLWPEKPPGKPQTAVQGYISSLRKLLGRETIETAGGGYQLRAEPEQLDLGRFERLLREGREALAGENPSRAEQLLEDALALWRGPALADFAYEPWAESEVGRLEELRLVAQEELIAARLTLGQHAELVGELEVLVVEQPLRERPRAQLMLALYRSGRQAEALDQYRRAREQFSEELGIDPGPELRLLHKQILNQDSALDTSRSLARTPGNLPQSPNPLIGRDRELDDLQTLLEREDVRLLTLTGPGGTGKTRLALQLATGLVDQFEQGVFFVDLSAITDPALVLPTIAQTLGAREQVGQQIEETLGVHLRERRVLLVLDNFEQVLDAAPEISMLLRLTIGSKLVVTSRARLRLAGEHEYPVEALTEPEALELFVERAQAVKPSFVLDGNRPLIAEICARVDRLPLAVELAAARMKVLPERALLERLDQRLDLLTGGGRDLDERQRTLRATIEWSHDLLDENEQQLFRRLAVFAGGCTLEAAEAIADADIDTLQSLIDKSLVRFAENRYWMLETVRDFALEQLAGSNEHDEVPRRHAEWYADLSDRLRGAVQHGHSEETARFEEELDNFRAALEWGARESAKTVFVLVGGLWSFWVSRALVAEGLRWAGWVVDARGAMSPTDALDGLIGASELLRLYGDQDEALRLKYELIEAFDRLGDGGRADGILGDISQIQAQRGEIEAAREAAREELTRRRSTGDPGGIGHALASLALVDFYAGDFAPARRRYEEARVQFQLAEWPLQSAIALFMEAQSARRDGDCDTARELFRRSSSLVFELRERDAIPEFLQEVAALTDRAEDAVRLIGASERFVDELGVRRWDPSDYKHTVAHLECSLTPEAFHAAHEEGRSLTESEALELAMRYLC
jgi:predicted ATPase/DNA-binding SARP family transcriptional activator